MVYDGAGMKNDRIASWVAQHKRKSMPQAELIKQVADELHIMLFDSGMSKADSQVVAAALRGKIIRDDWKD